MIELKLSFIKIQQEGLVSKPPCLLYLTTEDNRFFISTGSHNSQNAIALHDAGVGKFSPYGFIEELINKLNYSAIRIKICPSDDQALMNEAAKVYLCHLDDVMQENPIIASTTFENAILLHYLLQIPLYMDDEYGTYLISMDDMSAEVKDAIEKGLSHIIS